MGKNELRLHRINLMLQLIRTMPKEDLEVLVGGVFNIYREVACLDKKVASVKKRVIRRLNGRAKN